MKLVQDNEAPELEGGPAPVRAAGETISAWIERHAAWELTPAGKVATAAAAARRAEDEKRAASEDRRARMDRIGIPARYRFVADPEAVIDETQAIAAVQGGAELLVLSGAAGSGKTAASCWWLMQSPRGVRDPRFTTAARLARLSKFDSEAMGEVLRAGRLVIDDLAVEYSDEKGFFLSLLDEIVNERYAEKLPTLITTNIDAATFKARCGERIADRVREAGRFVSLDNPSLRRRA